MQQEQEGSLDKLSHMFRLPDIKRLGIELDVPKGVVVKRSEGAAHAAGLQAGDRITALNNTTVWTFGDLQFHYDHVPRQAIRLGVTYVDPAAKLLKRHDLLVGDIIYAVDVAIRVPCQQSQETSAKEKLDLKQLVRVRTDSKPDTAALVPKQLNSWRLRTISIQLCQIVRARGPTVRG